MLELTYDLINEDIQDTKLVSNNTDFEMVAAGLDGIVLTQLEKKRSRVDVIMQFMDAFGLITDETVTETLKDFDIKLSFAILIRKYQERLKTDAYH